MRLVTLHKILIGSAIGATVLFAVWAIWMYSARDSRPHLAMAALAGTVAAGLVIYLQYFIRRTGRRGIEDPHGGTAGSHGASPQR